jgi:hypothetical protein
MAPLPVVTRDRAVYAFDRPEVLSLMLLEAGFTDVEARCIEIAAVFRDEEEWWTSLGSNGAKELLDLIPPDARRRFKADAFRALAPMKGPAGIPLSVKILQARGAR